MYEKKNNRQTNKTRTFVTVNVDLQVRVSAVCVVYYVWIDEIVCNVCWLPSLDVLTFTYMYLMKCNYFHGIPVLYTLYNMKDHNETKICLCNAAEIAKRFNEYIDFKKKSSSKFCFCFWEVFLILFHNNVIITTIRLISVNILAGCLLICVTWAWFYWNSQLEHGHINANNT